MTWALVKSAFRASEVDKSLRANKERTLEGIAGATCKANEVIRISPKLTLDLHFCVIEG